MSPRSMQTKTRAASSTARALWIEAPGRASLRVENIGGARKGTSLLEPEFGAVSVGTERLVARGSVPEELHGSMACRYQAGGLGLPVKYGYSMAGRVTEGTLAGQRVFCMHPHQELARIEDAHAVPLPDAVPTRRAVLFPNLETALNAVWDGELTAHEPYVVFGAGALGLLTAFAAHAETGRAATVVESDPARRAAAAELPWVARAVAPDAAPDEGLGECDVAFHTTATGAGLQAALDAVGFEGRVVELSWYGTTAVELRLGGGFHSQRKRLIASQVAHVAPRERERLGYAGRTARVLELLGDPGLDRLLSRAMPFSQLPDFLGRLCRGASVPVVPLIDYSV